MTKTEQATIVCEHIFLNTRDILVISHDTDGWWQCLCGDPECLKHVERAHVVGLNPSIAPAVEQPEGTLCKRSSTEAPWSMSQLDI